MNKKKIGILTFHWSDNYGAVLQAYALQTFIRLNGFDCEIIDYLPPSRSLIKRLVSKSPSKQIDKLTSYAKSLAFKNFRKNFLVLSENSFRSVDSLSNEVLSQYSAIVVGSDQVWNPSFHTSVNDFFELYMLSFVNSLIKISYAASIGHACKDSFSREAHHYFYEFISRFDHISVREKSAVELLRTLGVSKPIQHVCDPTILLDANQYNFGMAKPRESRYLFSYILHDCDSEFLNLNELLADLLKCSVITCNSKSLFRKTYVLPSPADWVSLLRNALFVSTNSFHGVVFAVKYHVPFLAVKLSAARQPMNTRIESLLSMLGLSSRLVASFDVTNKTIIDAPIDWADVDARIAVFRKSSSFFILNALNSPYPK